MMNTRLMKRKKSIAANTRSKKSKSISLQTKKQEIFTPSDIWFNIFLCLSAKCLYSIMTRVCNPWGSIIRDPYFVDTHLRRSRSGLFIQKNATPFGARFLEIIDDKLEITDLGPGYPGAMHASYKGVSMFRLAGRPLHILNPVTMHCTEIYLRDDFRRCAKYNYALTRDRHSGEFKLVVACQDVTDECSWFVQKIGIENYWTKMSTGSHKFGRFCYFPLSIGGFLIYVLFEGHNNIAVLDVSEETVHRIFCPAKNHVQDYVEMGDYLCCVSRCSKKFYIHILKDFRDEEWILYRILDVGFVNREPTGHLGFYGWISNGEEMLLYLYTSGQYVTYNLKKKIVRYLDCYISKSELVRVHTNSLVSWKTQKV